VQKSFGSFFKKTAYFMGLITVICAFAIERAMVQSLEANSKSDYTA
jgi:hypothetical protein